MTIVEMCNTTLIYFDQQAELGKTTRTISCATILEKNKRDFSCCWGHTDHHRLFVHLVHLLLLNLGSTFSEPQVKILGKFFASLRESSRIGGQGLMEVQAVTAVIALRQVVWLTLADGEVNGSALPRVVREIGVEDLLCLGESSAIHLVHALGRWEHLNTESLLALLQVIVQVHLLSTQRSRRRSSVEVRNLVARLPAPRAGVDVPTLRVGQLLSVVWDKKKMTVSMETDTHVQRCKTTYRILRSRSFHPSNGWRSWRNSP